MSQPNPDHRQCLLIEGDQETAYGVFSGFNTPNSSLLISAPNTHLYDGFIQDPNIKTCPFNQVKNELGQSYDAVMIDLTDGVSANVLAVLAGTVKGGGLFALVLPEDQQVWLTQTDSELSRYLPWPLESSQVPANFKRYFLSNLYSETSPFQKALDTITVNESPQIDSNRELTHEQKRVQHAILSEQNQTHVLLAPRGRGKSTLLGDTVAQWQKQGLKVAITAQNPDALISARRQFERLALEETPHTFPFYAPDALIQMDQNWDHLVVDEAARLPLPMLEALLEKAQHCIFSTTDYGYEGAGKGFGIRFCQYLEKHAKPLSRLTLQAPIRWGENDPLENWINQLFFLTPPFTSSAKVNEVESGNQYLRLTGADWLTHNQQLESAFTLLVNAHYQTSPDNLRWMLDDPSVETWLCMNQDDKPSCVAITTVEGGLPDDLCQEILAGRRRPRGHLLPQSLLAHAGLTDAGQYHYLRVSRIATQSYLQGKGLASGLLEKLTQEANENTDFICTSFAATPEMVRFWKKNGFRCVRLGTSKDKSSGCYSLMMVKPLNNLAKTKADQWEALFYEEFLYGLTLQYHDLHAALVIELLAQPKATFSLPMLVLSEQDKANLALFAQAHRPFDTVRASLFKQFLLFALKNTLDSQNTLDCLMLDAVLNKPLRANNKEISGRKALHQAVKDKILTNG